MLKIRLLRSLAGPALAGAALAGAALLASLVEPMSAVQSAASGFSDLFNGRSLHGWKPSVADAWTVADKLLVHRGAAASTLSTTFPLGDVDVRLEYRREPDAHVGVLLRGAGLLDLQGPPSAWQTLEIRQLGERVSVSSTGGPSAAHQRLTGPNGPLPRVGPLVLQAKGGVQIRLVSVRQIDPVEANRLLAASDAEGFVAIFNGRDFTGWTGAVENYEVADGALLCKPGKGGTIYTKATYRNFIARLEFNLPAGGNNGLAIRYPGEGDAAYAGMTELQVLDDMAAQYATLDPRQAHGSAYGMAAAKRGYLRRVGEWNFQEVTVRGSRIQVELNGTMILDTDLAKVTRFLEDRAHPGKDRTSGHFGFAGHGDPVRFRNVRMKGVN